MITNTRRLTQKERVIEILRRVGKSGIHSFHIIREISHKAPARISELRREGWDIQSRPEMLGRAHGVRYTLNEDNKEDSLIEEAERIFNSPEVEEEKEHDQQLVFDHDSKTSEIL